MSWKELALGDALHIKHGYAFKSRYFSDDATKWVVLTPGNFLESGGFRARPEKDRGYFGEVPGGFVLDEGDLIVAMTEQGPGLLGSSALVPERGRYLHNQRLGLVDALDEDLFDKTFLYYLFNTRYVRHQISASASGTKVRHTSPGRIYRVKVRVPEVAVQKSIAEVLSTYDDLIENNRRRIQLLEKAARLLYKEWFVHLRFPGHEHAKIVDCLPNGWVPATLGELLTLKRGYDLPERLRKPGAIPIVSSSGVTGTHSVARVNAPGIVTGRCGTLGKVHLLQTNFWPLNTSLYVVDFKGNDLFFLYCLLDDLLSHTYSDKAAVPGVNRNDLHMVRTVCPPALVQARFGNVVRPMFEQVRLLRLANEKAARIRDILLPRLINGEFTP